MKLQSNKLESDESYVVRRGRLSELFCGSTILATEIESWVLPVVVLEYQYTVENSYELVNASDTPSYRSYL